MQKKEEKDLCLQSCWTCPTHDDSKWNKSHFSRIFRRTTRQRTATRLFRSYIHTLEPVQWLNFMSGIQTKGQHDQSGITASFHASSGVQRDNIQPPGFLEATYTRVCLMIGFHVGHSNQCKTICFSPKWYIRAVK